ncbi:hypothetical protein C347_06703 [Cryptococcus neoformans AD2-60a]|uniref:Store-operated calcium entry-associated regulatory factor n=1 Tax=Cryptococcus neoformans (strain H99 / ATCC 208821 / CBS 10515 / FGSC 9487) TaxID=235443 RepID=J9W155_CRYN9|nr:hypothetical protein CNAG_07943 [Cryptococcus neoformans var. grubii H99]AUB28904.1 hypothetical protein CKF44_07943 [Cryptococcus neoformans var. grubii]OWZ26476.1 hypothetical protein C347_06703 [Cryptococcus neoformans var. grubii AD2-60a]OXG33123.1 hypothetical protein C359_06677 [Cryptococcus neoformans var. grubii Bt120]OXG35027.1 hypothetical protein C360_03041 [Cryptococcus neoformans var. grubii Bt15]AFR98719.1 hypothetical protein CNAG_07943 [Cryptococcus neoformans var. grubii H9|eukprot:XP_012053560.1 hypothetical protein CNAG_07943 [Cryptococcus neoformans var. grubii H99]
MRRNTAGGAKKIALSAVKTLTFYADKYTAGRRTNPIPQLTCKGPGCKVFQPDVVQCTNMGDDGLGNVQWKCDTDLPSSLRLGKVDVSCEGWSAPGDPNILQGSCGLTYNLYKVNKGLEYGEDPYSTLPSSYDRLFNKAFNIIFYLVTLIILYNLFRALLGRFMGWRLPGLWPGGGGGGGDGGGGGGGGGGWWGGRGPGGGGPGFGGGQAPPPPYTKHAHAHTHAHALTHARTQPQQQTQADQGTWWNPGFWTGLALGGFGAWLANNRNNNHRARERGDGYEYQYRYRAFPRRGLFGGGEDDWGRGMRLRRMVDADDNDDEPWGPAARTGGVGEMRRATGFGGTSTR